MKMRILSFVTLTVLALGAPLIMTTSVHAQNLSDGVRLDREQLPVTGRSIAMGNSLIAGVDNYSALALNPAALAPLAFRELGLSLFHRTNNSVTSSQGTTSIADINTTQLGSFGFAAPIPTRRGHLAFGISYDRVYDYTNDYAFGGVNTRSSLLNTRSFIDDPGIGVGETVDEYHNYLLDNNIAYTLGLTEDIDSNNTQLRTRLTSGLSESGRVSEEGSLRALRVGGGVDIAEGVSVGATLNVLFGNYEYRRNFTVTDVNGVFSGETGKAPNGFRNATITDTRTQDQTGYSLKLGLLAYALDAVRFGLTIETPTYYSIEDASVRSGKSNFSSGESLETSLSHEPLIVNEYSIVTPLKVGLGVSGHMFNTTLSGSVKYHDASQTRFSSDIDVSDLNDNARVNLGSVLAWSVGAEHIIAPIGVALRAGFGIDPSPYKADTTPEYDTKTLSAGASVLISKSIVLDAAYRRSSFRTDHVLYNDVTPDGAEARSTVDIDDIIRHEISLSFGYRF